MAFGKLVDKAKATASKTKATAGSKAKEVSLDTTITVKESTQRIVSVRTEEVRGRLGAVLSEINELKPIPSECGFIAGDISVTLSLPPEFKVIVEQIGESKESVEHILEENESTMTKTQMVVLTSLVKADKMAQIANKHDYCVRRYELVATLPPRATVVLKPNKDVYGSPNDRFEEIAPEKFKQSIVLNP